MSGCPPKWSPSPLPTRLRQDAGLVYIDQNSSRNSPYPLEPLFRAVFAGDASFNPKKLDVVTDRNNLRKLLRVIRRENFELFRIDIELAGNTLLLSRWERDTEEYVTEFRGFGHEFEKAFTTHASSRRGQKSESSGHHRIIQYEFGGLVMLVRFETDAHHGQLAAVPTPSDNDLDDLTTAIKSVSLKSKDGGGDKKSSQLSVTLQGRNISQDSLIEIKTRVKHRRLVMDEVAPQLFFAQVPHLIVGYHVRGVFQTVEEHNLRDKGVLDKFERDNANELKKVVTVLETIRKEVGKVKGSRAVLLCERGSLCLYERSELDKHVLPADLLAKWADIDPV